MRRIDGIWSAGFAVVACALLAGPATATAADPPEAPVTEACAGPIAAGSAQHLCGTLNPGLNAKVGYYFEVRGGSSCSGGILGGTHFDGPSEVEGQGVAVSIEVNGFAPDTEYTYCLVATNASGETSGQGVTFVTPPPPPPSLSVDSQSVTGVTSTDATLNAVIDPNGLTTAYELQIDTTGNFKFFQTSGCPLNVPEMGCTTEVRSGDPLAPGLVQPPEYILPASDAPQHVSVNMAAIGATLQPGTTYHYRALAANRTGYVYGPDQTFTAPGPSTEPPAPDPIIPVPQRLLTTQPQADQPPRQCRKNQVKKRGKCRHRPRNASARSTRAVRR